MSAMLSCKTMVEMTRGYSPNQFGARLQRYLQETLHFPVQVERYREKRSLPAFFGQLYELYQTEIAGARCLILASRETVTTPANIAKHVAMLRDEVPTTIIFAADGISSYNRSRLIKLGVAFAIPGNQLYMPQLALDLREHFRPPKDSSATDLPPAAQVVLFHHLLRPGKRCFTASLIAGQINLSAMTVGRAFDDLVATGLAQVHRRGRERILEYVTSGRQLVEQARAYLRPPARKVHHFQHAPRDIELKIAGESALARLTDLNPPKLKTYAIASVDWRSLVNRHFLREVPAESAEFAIERWSYDPVVLSEQETVDPLSLYAQFWQHPDERVALASASLLEQVAWS